MTKPIIRIHDIETDQILDREMTEEEYETYSIELEKNQKELEAIAAKKLARTQLLEKLGISEVEAKLLIADA